MADLKPRISVKPNDRAYVPLPGVEFSVDPNQDKEARETIRADVTASALQGFVALARYGMHTNLNPTLLDLGSPARSRALTIKVPNEADQGWGEASPGPSPSPGTSPARSRWIRNAIKVEGSLAAKRLREAARLKALQRTPYPMVLSRLKLLLERLQMLNEEEEVIRSPTKTGFNPKAASARFRSASFSGNRGNTDTQASVVPTRAAEKVGAAVHRPASPTIDGTQDLPAKDRVREELATTFSYVSDFLRKVPEETRVASIEHARMEMYKKDQNIYVTGDEPNKFYIILTGNVDMWTSTPGDSRHRTVLASLKRGQSFGEREILNQEPRSECATPTSNCTFLVLDAAPFQAVFGEYFEQQLVRAQDFFLHQVDMFRKVPAADGNTIVRHMLHSVFPQGKEWEPQTEAQIYFIKSGMANLESHDRRSQSVVITRSMLGLHDGTGDDDAPVVAETGILSNVLIKDGRAIGTLGHEEEIRRLKRQLIPKKVIGTLGTGSHFGGGPAAMGSGDLQASLRVMSSSPLEVYHCHIQVFLKHATPEMLNALRDDIAFKLTYCFGRVGSPGPEPIIGHPDSLLATCLNKQQQQLHQDRDDRSSPIPGAAPRAAGAKKKRVQKHIHEHGRFNPEVEKALQYIKSLQAHNQVVRAGAMDSVARAKLGGQVDTAFPVPGYMEYLVHEGSTPSERFWTMPALSSSSAITTSLAPLLKQVYPEGLKPLTDKIDQLVRRVKGPGGLDGPLSRLVAESCSSPTSEDRYSSGAARERPGGAAAGTSQLRPATAPSHAALISAGLIWERSSDMARVPALRQCLTFEEIARVKAEQLHHHHL